MMSGPMPLTECKSCGKEISRKAETCPHCGHAYVPSFIARYRRVSWGCMWIFVAFLATIFIVAIIRSI
jgi:predicted RNA-binding Zn-ribbon protein involved in translation (DUF1610 family)